MQERFRGSGPAPVGEPIRESVSESENPGERRRNCSYDTLQRDVSVLFGGFCWFVAQHIAARR